MYIVFNIYYYIRRREKGFIYFLVKILKYLIYIYLLNIRNCFYTNNIIVYILRRNLYSIDM